MTAWRKLYTNDERDAAVTRIVAGEAIAAASRDTEIPAITTKRYPERRRTGLLEREQRRGTKPTLPLEAEEDIVYWVAPMQRSGAPVGREAIVGKANAVHHRLHGNTRSVKDLTSGWYRRFRERHPVLVARVAQKVSRARNAVVVGDLRTLFHTLAKLTIEHRLQSSQVFNTDETSFTSRTNTTKVVAVKGSPNARTSSPATSFHLSFVTAVAACGFAVPPALHCSWVRVSRPILDECAMEGAVITTTPKGFIKATSS